jgi:hypothetical protein
VKAYANAPAFAMLSVLLAAESGSHEEGAMLFSGLGNASDAADEHCRSPAVESIGTSSIMLESIMAVDDIAHMFNTHKAP